MSLLVQRESPVFISIEEAFQATSRLKRLITLENALSSSAQACKKRSGYIEKIVSIWKRLDENQSFGLTQKSLQAAFESCSGRIVKTLPFSVIEEMVSRISSVGSMADLKVVRDRVFKDCATLEVSKTPVNKSLLGKLGPTLLVEYSNPGQRHNGLVSYALKWTDKNETAGYLIYEALFAELGLDHWRVPEHCWYDFENQIYLDSNGLFQKLDKNTAKDLGLSFFSIPSLMGVEEIHGKQVLVMERIKGGNLSDFFRVNYNGLNIEQKKNLFRDFGRMAMLDLLLGNTDRLLMLHWGEDYIPDLGAAPCNLGNLMLAERDDGSNFLYAIDNSVDVKFIDNPRKRNNYSRFVFSLLERKGFEREIANRLRLSFDSAFTDMIDQYKEDHPGTNQYMQIEKDEQIETDEQIEKDLQIETDLLTIRGNKCLKCRLGESCSREGKCVEGDLDKDFVGVAIEEGVLDMAFRLKELVPEWKSKRADFLKSQLKTAYPEYLKTLEERFDAFDRLKIGNSAALNSDLLDVFPNG